MAVTVASLVAKMGYDDGDFTRGLNDSESRLGKFGSVIKTGMTLAVSGVAAGVAAITASMISVEDALTPVMTITGKSTEQFKAMSSGIKDVISTSPKSAQELGNAAYTILSAGITDTNTALLALKDANALSLAGLGTVPDSVDLITSAMNSWKDANLTSTDAAQILFGTVQAGKTTVADLAQGFGNIAPLASAVGVNFNELMSATAALTAVGMPASTAYAGLRGAFSNILKPSKDAEDAAKKLGVSFDLATLKSKGLIGFLGYIAEAANGDTQSLTDMFGSVEGVNAVLALTGPQAGAVADNFATISEKGKALDQTAKDVSDTLSNRFKIAKNEVMIHLNDIGTKGLDWLEQKATDWKIGEKIEIAKDKIGDALKTARGFFDDFIDGWNSGTADTPGSPAGFFQNLGDRASDFKNIITGVFDESKTALDDFVNGWNSGTVDTPGSPMGFFENLGDAASDAKNAIVEAFTVIGAGFGEFSDVMKGSGGRAKKDGWLGNVDAFALFMRDNMPTMISMFRDLKSAWEEIKIWSEENWPKIQGLVEVTLGAIAGSIAFTLAAWQGMIITIKAVKDLITDVMVPGFQGLAGIITDEVWPALKLIGRVINEEVFPALDLIGRFVATPVMVTFGAFSALIRDVIWPALKLIPRVINEEIIPAFNALVGAVAWAGNTTINILGWIRYNMIGTFANAGTWLWNAGWNVVMGIIHGMEAGAGWLYDKARSLADGVKNIFGKVWNMFSPSRVTEQYGKNFVEGLVIGIDKASVNAIDAAANLAGAMVSATQYNYSIGGPGNVQVVMPNGANGNDVVRALKDWQRVNGNVPIKVAG